MRKRAARHSHGAARGTFQLDNNSWGPAGGAQFGAARARVYFWPSETGPPPPPAIGLLGECDERSWAGAQVFYRPGTNKGEQVDLCIVHGTCPRCLK